jgi:hypothetical protein
MKTKFAIGFLIGLLVLGSVRAWSVDDKTAFEAAKRKAADLHASLISQASPPARAKISAAAVASRKYLAGCGRRCDLQAFLSRDLKARFPRLTQREVDLLMALVFAETLNATGDDSQLINIDLQDTLQKQQQFIQTISNIMKAQHDTLKAIIQNLR